MFRSTSCKRPKVLANGTAFKHWCNAPIQTVGFPGRWGKSMRQHNRYLCANFRSDLGPLRTMPEFERLGYRRFEWRSQENHRVHVCIQHNLVKVCKSWNTNYCAEMYLVFLPGEISELQTPFNARISVVRCSGL